MKRHRASAATRIAALSTAFALICLTVYFIVIGLDNADKLASVLSALTGLTALALTWHTMRRPTEPSPPTPPGKTPDKAPAAPVRTTSKREGGTVHNVISGSVHGPVVQGHDFTGPITIGGAGAGTAPPPPPPESDRKPPAEP
ncbi:hypothetical protein AB0M95_25945 [Sphaerisporangium sp. NPDC051017]|uniref:hypothetical protein n=1 Tax=Sphaerisporangium sp. NPDC051017 TaxID=3154636 RepID=UPI0034400E16